MNSLVVGFQSSCSTLRALALLSPAAMVVMLLLSSFCSVAADDDGDFMDTGRSRDAGTSKGIVIIFVSFVPLRMKCFFGPFFLRLVLFI